MEEDWDLNEAGTHHPVQAGGSNYAATATNNNRNRNGFYDNEELSRVYSHGGGGGYGRGGGGGYGRGGGGYGRGDHAGGGGGYGRGDHAGGGGGYGRGDHAGGGGGYGRGDHAGGGGGYGRGDRGGGNSRGGGTGWRKPGEGSGGGGAGGGGRNYAFSNYIDIGVNCIGLIIGRAGANIQRIQTEYKVRVDLDKGSGRATVLGNTESSVNDALNCMREQLMESENRGASGSGGGARVGGGGANYGGERRTAGNTYYNSSYGAGSDAGGYRGGGKGGGYSAGSGAHDTYARNSGSYERSNNDFYNSSNTIATESNNGGEIIDWSAMNKKAEDAREKRWADRPPLTKNFYQEVEEVANLSPEEVARMRAQKNNISVSRVFQENNTGADDIPNPVWEFEQCFAAYADLLAEIQKQGFVEPSPIQSQAWPVLLRGDDLIGIAQTGTGKTLAFLLPAMIHTEYQTTPRSERGGPNVLVMAPTRELALQIEKEVKKYSFRGMKAVCIYGGGSRRDQISSVERGVEIIICTPGRLNDLIQAKVIDVGSITYLVLDEADRMLDMGFEPQIRKILLDIRPDRQTVMTSATWPPGVRRLAQNYMNNPIQVCVGSLDLAATHSVHQIVEILDEGDKFFAIKNFVMNMMRDDKIIIFCGRKTRADDLSSDLTLGGIMCQCIHGSRDQSDREQAIADITSGEVKVLIATDVASRGLDIEDITHVINYDFPRNIEEYVHRVGRTGRAGRTGISISYITREDWAMAAELINILEEADQLVPIELRDMAARFKSMKEKRASEGGSSFGNRGSRGGGRGFRGGAGGGGGGGGFSGRRDRF